MGASQVSILQVGVGKLYSLDIILFSNQQISIIQENTERHRRLLKGNLSFPVVHKPVAH